MSFWFLCYGESSVSCRVWASIIRMMKEELDLISDFSVLGWLPCPFLFFLYPCLLWKDLIFILLAFGVIILQLVHFIT